MAKKPKDEKPKADGTRKKRESRDYAQRAHDVVHEALRRHEERHKDDDPAE
jgi:hypothetical protein